MIGRQLNSHLHHPLKYSTWSVHPDDLVGRNPYEAGMRRCTGCTRSCRDDKKRSGDESTRSIHLRGNLVGPLQSLVVKLGSTPLFHSNSKRTTTATHHSQGAEIARESSGIRRDDKAQASCYPGLIFYTKISFRTFKRASAHERTRNRKLIAPPNRPPTIQRLGKVQAHLTAAATMDVINPSTGALSVTLATDTSSTLQGKFAALSRSKWADSSVGDRVAVVRAFQSRLMAAADELAATMAKEVGKPVSQGRGEVEACGYRIDWFVENVPGLLDEESPNSTTEDAAGHSIAYEPAGIVCFLSAWNFPVLMLVDFLTPAILTGNTVLLKPSEHATQTALALARLLHSAGLPSDSLQVAVGGADVGAAVVAHEELDSLVFIGSSTVGSQVQRDGLWPIACRPYGHRIC